MQNYVEITMHVKREAFYHFQQWKRKQGHLGAVSAAD